ncbi:SDR family NAD(P)-dependent oxidoreductase [Streptomyces caniscabiei]|uniref:SDR family NAD(P)-dependent oxidoreductase n=1 Tax=Streptomyces caniscabiei TaxID=2746961 RepID=UPI001F1C20B8|nr:SDR family oxidoreductase [Streptomyces caniscabiei]MDX3732859.1 SDR family oxidoreductase [Streptomyces caniscabiei]
MGAVSPTAMNRIDYRAQTTLITGASAGLGAEFARQFAERGSDLVLVARRADRLQALADELSAKYHITATVVPFDLTAPAAGEALAQEMTRREITVTSLVNNAGFGTHSPFRQEDPARVQQEINLNVAALVDVTRAFIGQLTGVLVNVASSLGYQPWPNAAVYGATKAFVLSFTEALWQESRGTGLRVLALSPGPTRTEFFDTAGSDDMARGVRLQTPRQVVTTALRTLDKRNPPPSVVSGTFNWIMTLTSRFTTRRANVLAFGAMTQWQMRSNKPGPQPAH